MTRYLLWHRAIKNGLNINTKDMFQLMILRDMMIKIAYKEARDQGLQTQINILKVRLSRMKEIISIFPLLLKGLEDPQKYWNWSENGVIVIVVNGYL